MGSCIGCEESEPKTNIHEQDVKPYPSIEDVIVKRQIQKRKQKKKNASTTVSRDSKQSKTSKARKN